MRCRELDLPSILKKNECNNLGMNCLNGTTCRELNLPSILKPKECSD